ncbi:hypothetical protein [Pseudorhodoferax soli]|uniref:Uncharacterized protein n=1 Tax=Pseudorhodoferax soli TaxID=545864 RepID=A0A368XGS2_9BURK|nr:hypothetical protein DES41_113138 [Pseudorhodoferax soli]
MGGATNAFKSALAQPQALIGLWLGLADPYTAELCATAGARALAGLSVRWGPIVKQIGFTADS